MSIIFLFKTAKTYSKFLQVLLQALAALLHFTFVWRGSALKLAAMAGMDGAKKHHQKKEGEQFLFSRNDHGFLSWFLYLIVICRIHFGLIKDGNSA
ncbi:hypothetical protein [Candidatus Spongiihabitans sp.]|uniref:hypothetical protein n=1 Tax=Candidatus Spongiihabitans sp. TaxID=3101308 RepID=UPI003C7A1ACC